MTKQEEQAGAHATSRRSADVIETTVTGRVTAKMIRAWGEDWARLHKPGSDGTPAPEARVWFFDAMRLVSYSADAVPEATRMMMRLKSLRAIVVATKSTLVKLGASIVHKALRATTGVDVSIFDTLEAAEAHLARISPTL
jgi:hypothetical protein